MSVAATAAPELLASFVDPEVGDPFGADEDRASGVASQEIAIPRRQQIVPANVKAETEGSERNKTICGAKYAKPG